MTDQALLYRMQDDRALLLLSIIVLETEKFRIAQVSMSVNEKSFIRVFVHIRVC